MTYAKQSIEISTSWEHLLEMEGIKYKSWSPSRRKVAEEQFKYLKAGIEVGAIDGFVGPQTEYARTIWKAKETGQENEELTWRDKDVAPVTLKQNKTTWPTQSGVMSYFGTPGTSQVQCKVPYDMVIAWAPTKKIRQFSCHRLVKDSLEYIWNKTLDKYGYEKIVDLRLHYFGGCLNVRKMRGGSAWSMHSWGIAVDLDPERNQLKWGKDKASFAKPEYDEFWKIVYETGAISLGIEKNFDWMHLQFARI